MRKQWNKLDLSAEEEAFYGRIAISCARHMAEELFYPEYTDFIGPALEGLLQGHREDQCLCISAIQWTCVQRRCIDELRKIIKRHKNKPYIIEFTDQVRDMRGANNYERFLSRRHMHEAIDRLPDVHRTRYQMKLAGYTLDEIGAEFGVGRAAICRSLKYYFKKLKNELNGVS